MAAADYVPFLSTPGDEAGLAAAIAALARDADLRKAVGAANRARATAEYDEQTMVDRYRALYSAAVRPGVWG